jgi:predicted restriction endonuclease
MPEEKNEKRRTYEAKKGPEYYARQSKAERERRNLADLERYKSESPEKRKRRNALWRQAWAKRKQKADMVKMSSEQIEREVKLLGELAPEARAMAHKLYIRSSNAIDDLGTDIPDYSLSEKWSYTRDQNVRKAVLKRAKGKCEFCAKPGFLGPNGKPYLETHHVIFLAKEGADRTTNVIALCPNDHREAHFGKRRVEIEKEMIQRLKALKR